uniref:BED-type domain-containing protein n=1 Tax=Chenopodium quinoa TaxID=63459 RepID=A0A803N115_CHEQI
MEASCKYCGMRYKRGTKRNGTSPLWAHINRCHNDWKLQKTILNFCPISSHKGADVGKEIEKCLLDLELEKIFCIIVDNASSDDIAIRYMRRKINGWKTGVLKGWFHHMRCVAHIVNLVVSDGLKIVNECITRVRHVVRFIKQSSARLLKFKKCRPPVGPTPDQEVPSAFLKLASA